MKYLTWVVDGEAHEVEVVFRPCPFCGAVAITELPPPILAEQPDDTTHVCNPGLGGCNHGFSMED